MSARGCPYFKMKSIILSQQNEPVLADGFISWLGAPYFEPEDNEECGFRMKRNLILEVPHEMYNDELFCTLLDNDVLLPLKEGDIIEAGLCFQAYEDDGVGHQEIILNSIKKQKGKGSENHQALSYAPWDGILRAPWEKD